MWTCVTYLQQQTVVDLREDRWVVVDIPDSDGDEDRRGKWRITFICRLNRQGVMRSLKEMEMKFNTSQALMKQILLNLLNSSLLEQTD